MTNKTVCDACDEEVSGKPRIYVSVEIRWDWKEHLHFHTEEACIDQIPTVIKETIQKRQELKK